MSSASNGKEEAALKEFRERIPDLLKTFNYYRKSDQWLLRWLRARELDVVKAEEMLRKHMQWRLDNDVENIMEWQPPEIIDKEFIMQASGFDKEGCIVATVPFGRWDLKKICSMGLRKEFVHYVTQIFEQCMRVMEHRSTQDKIVTQFVVIFDFEGYSLTQLTSKETIAAAGELLRIFEANHPETLKDAYCINAPKIFELFFALVKPLLTARTISKIQVFGSNPTAWKKAIMTNVDPDQLPSDCGGAICSPFNYKARFGFNVYPDYETLPESATVSVTVPAGSQHRVEYLLAKDSRLNWNFKTTEFEIAFKLTCKPDGASEEKTVFSFEKVDSHLYLQKGVLTADYAGKYSLIFDNSHSKTKAKSLFYAIRVTQNAPSLGITRV